MSDILKAQLRKNPPRTQEEIVALTVRQCLAIHGEVEDDCIRSAAEGLAKGLFGPAFVEASADQREKWVVMAEVEYRRAVAPQVR